MKNCLSVAIATVFVLSLIACQADNEKLDSDAGLVGTWEWVRTDGGLAFHIHETPSSSGQTVHLKFTRDKKFYRFVNGTLSASGTYSLANKKCIHSAENKTLISFSEPSIQEMMIDNLHSDTLEISDEYYDGTGSQFKRVADKTVNSVD
jgi:hypothetical protein